MLRCTSGDSEYVLDVVTDTSGMPVVRVWRAKEERGEHVGDVAAGTVVALARKGSTPK